MKARPQARAVASAPAGQVRIIGGQWRGTKLAVPALPGLRPTSDRARETLFNWLMPALPDARVLDLYAGTGALGLEALSRGAASAVFVERDAALITALRGVVAKLAPTPAATIVQGDALQWLAHGASEFDIAFVDPPFADDLWQRTFTVLTPRMAADAWLYVETPAVHPAQPGPEWMLHREGATRDARHRLFRRMG